MKKFAAHFIFLPAMGFAKRQAVEVSDQGTVQKVFPWDSEAESVEWRPGVIALLSADQWEKISGSATCATHVAEPLFHLFSCPPTHRIDLSEAWGRQEKPLFPVLLYPFDFTSMRPVAETRHTLLR